MKDLEKEIYQYLEERSWHKLRPGDLAKSVAIEAGELLEIFQWNNPSLEEVKADQEKVSKIKSELADVLMYCLDISVSLELDTEALVREKLEAVRNKYPAELFKNSTEEPGNDEAYWRIKKEHRKNHA